MKHVSLMRDFLVSEGRTDEQGDSRSWIINYICDEGCDDIAFTVMRTSFNIKTKASLLFVSFLYPSSMQCTQLLYITAILHANKNKSLNFENFVRVFFRDTAYFC